MPARLYELRLLKDGWFEGSCSAPTSAGIDWLSDKFTLAYPEDLPLPFVYPAPEGGIRLEWSLGSNDVTLDVDLAKHIASLHALNPTSDKEYAETLHLDEPAAWERLIQQIQQIAGASEAEMKEQGIRVGNE